jgi:hypothetical protein
MENGMLLRNGQLRILMQQKMPELSGNFFWCFFSHMVTAGYRFTPNMRCPGFPDTQYITVNIFQIIIF